LKENKKYFIQKKKYAHKENNIYIMSEEANQNDLDEQKKQSFLREPK
jgi:hypothetical protein